MDVSAARVSMENGADSLLQFLAEFGDAPEILWEAALALAARAIEEAREARFGRFRYNPAGQLRRLEAQLAHALKLAALGVAMQEAETEQNRGLDDELRERAAAAAKKSRRAQTLPAQLARLEKQRRRRAGLPTENFHLRADYPASGLRAEGGQELAGGEHGGLNGGDPGAGGTAAG